MSNPDYETISQSDFLDLPEYSVTVPTGATIGKRWRRRHRYLNPMGDTTECWYIGEYIEDPDPKMVGIKWTTPIIVMPDGTLI